MIVDEMSVVLCIVSALPEPDEGLFILSSLIMDKKINYLFFPDLFKMLVSLTA